jgi:hypothetical protein
MKYLITFVGVSPLLMHSCRGANPLDPATKEIKTYTSKRKKTDEDHETVLKLEYKLNAYWSEKLGWHIPSNIIEQCIIGASRKNKLGKVMPTAIRIHEDTIPLECDAPRDIDEAFKDLSFSDVRNVVVMGKRIMRCRPRFDRWRLQFNLELDESIVDSSDFLQALNYAGSLVGICDYRPSTGGKYGRFEVKVEKL